MERRSEEGTGIEEEREGAEERKGDGKSLSVGGGGVYALSASEAMFRARTYSHNLFSPVMMIT